MTHIDKLAEIRKEKGITQRDMSERLSISRDSLASYETGRRRMDHELVCDYAKALGLELKLQII